MKRPGEVRQKYDDHVETSLLAISNPAESEVRAQARSYEEPKPGARMSRAEDEA